MMILHQFRIRTSHVPIGELRRAMAGALTTELPRSPEAYERFYRRVLLELDSSDSTRATPAA